MNWSLFRSPHAYIAAAVSALFAIWWSVELGLEVLTEEPSRPMRLASGWLAFLCIVVVGAYGLRKYAHRGGYSPEFLMRTDYAKVAEGTRALQNLAARNASAGAADIRRLEREARGMLAKAGAKRVMRASFEIDAEHRLELHIRPTEPLGRVARWMGAHIWYGLLAGFALLLHAGLVTHSGLGLAQLLFFGLVFLSGTLGVFLWARGPSKLTAAEKDLSIEEASAIRFTLKSKRLTAVEAFAGPRAQALSGQRSPGEIAAIAQRLAAEGADDAGALQDLSTLCLQEARVSAEYIRLRTVRNSYMSWKLVHLPAVIVLAALVCAHLIVIWRF